MITSKTAPTEDEQAGLARVVRTDSTGRTHTTSPISKLAAELYAANVSDIYPTVEVISDLSYRAGGR